MTEAFLILKRILKSNLTMGYLMHHGWDTGKYLYKNKNASWLNNPYLYYVNVLSVASQSFIPLSVHFVCILFNVTQSVSLSCFRSPFQPVVVDVARGVLKVKGTIILKINYVSNFSPGIILDLISSLNPYHSYLCQINRSSPNRI